MKTETKPKTNTNALAVGVQRLVIYLFTPDLTMLAGLIAGIAGAYTGSLLTVIASLTNYLIGRAVGYKSRISQYNA